MKLEKKNHAPLTTKEVVAVLTLGRAPERKLQQKYQRTEHWKKLTELCIETYRTCVLCGHNQQLVVHHRHYRSLFREDPLRDVALLCQRCHGKHPRGRR